MQKDISSTFAQLSRRLQRVFPFFLRRSASPDLIHELSQPLTALTFHLESLEQLSEKISPEVRLKILSSIKAVDHMRDLLHLSREKLLQKETVTQPITFNPVAHCESIVEVLSPLAEERHIQLLLNAQKNDQEFWLAGNPTEFQQIVRNMVMNAIEAYDSGSSTENLAVWWFH